jgi:hypothetical protein
MTMRRFVKNQQFNFSSRAIGTFGFALAMLISACGSAKTGLKISGGTTSSTSGGDTALGGSMATGGDSVTGGTVASSSGATDVLGGSIVVAQNSGGVTAASGGTDAGTDSSMGTIFVPDAGIDIGARIIGSGSPSIKITSVPTMGQTGSASGQVSGVDPTGYAVAVYVKVAGGWYNKYSWSDPLTMIKADGTWSVYITPDPNDPYATEVAAYLVPIGYKVPMATGGSSLPVSLADFPSDSVSRLALDAGP